jgi:hypothetical protein
MCLQQKETTKMGENFGIFKSFGDRLFEGETPTNLGIIGSQSIGFNVDAQAFFDRVTAAGGSLTNDEKNAINALVVDMKSTNLWNSMQAIYPIVGASAASCAQNLKSASFTGAFFGGNTFASTGVTPNGINAYMTTGYTPSTSGLLNSAHLSYYSRTNFVAGQVDMGISGSPSHYLLFNYGGQGYNAINSAEAVGLTTPPTTLGLKIGSRNNTTTEEYNVNGTYQLVSRNSQSLPTNSIYLFCYNSGGNPSLFSSKECAFASIGSGLSQSQMVTFQTLMTIFQTALSRNV